MATERIQIIVSERGSRTVRRNLRGIGEDAGRAEGAVSLLRRTLGLLGAGLAVRELARLSDVATALRNRIAIAEGSIGDLSGAFDRLVGIANNARAPVDALGTLFTRASIAANELGASQEDLFNFVDATAKALAIQGGATNEARGALIQLSQSLGSGIVRAEEFNSILEGAFPLALAAAKGIDRAGGSVAKLRQLVVAGKISSDEFFRAILSQQKELTEQFERSSPTIGQAFTVLRNNFIQFINDVENSTGIAAKLSSVIIVLANNLELLAKAAVLAGAALTAAFVRGRIAAVTAYLTEVIALERALGALTTRQALLSAGTKGASRLWGGFSRILGVTPIGRVITLIGGAITALALFSDEISLARESGATLGDAFTATFQLIGEAIQPVTQFFADAWNAAVNGVSDEFSAFANFIGEVLQTIGSLVKTYVNTIIALWVGAINAIIAAFGGLVPALRDIGTQAINGLIAVVESGINAIITAVNTLFSGIDAARGVFGLDPIGEVFSPVKLERATNEFEGAARNLGTNVAGAFSEAFETDYVGNAADAILTRADQIARDRAASTNTGTAPTIPGGGSGGGGGGGKRGSKNQATFADELAALQREADLLQLGNREREIANGLLEIERSIKRGLTEEETALATAALKNIQSLEDQNRLLEELQGPQAQLQADLEAAKALFEAGRISADEYARALQNVAEAQLNLNESFGGGFKSAINDAILSSKEFGNAVGGIVVGGIDKAADAIVEFAQTGKINLRALFSELFAQLLKLAAQQLLLQLVGSLLGVPAAGGLGGGGGAGGGLGGLIGGLFGFENGGSFPVGGSGGPDSQLVAFKASPNERVTVETPEQQRAREQGANAAPVNNNVNVAAVLSPGDVVGAFDSDEGETLVVNMLQRNASTVRSIVQG